MFESCVLENHLVRLETMDSSHLNELAAAGDAADIWRFMPVTLLTPEHFGGFLQFVDDVRAKDEGIYFACRSQADGKVVGATGFWNADAKNLRAEIGFTWLHPDYQRTGFNTSNKLLLMEHGFESLKLNRIEFKTDSLNTKSREALKGIGATEEGTLRCHMIQPDGRLRHSVYFSVLKDEWPEVKLRLQSRLERHSSESH